MTDDECRQAKVDASVKMFRFMGIEPRDEWYAEAQQYVQGIISESQWTERILRRNREAQ